MAIRNRTHIGPSAIIPRRRDFVETPIATLIFDSFTWLRRTRYPILIVGAPGVGKSTALRQVLDMDQNARLFVATAANGKLKPFLEAVANKFYVYFSVGDSTASIERKLHSHLKEARSEYLIIDEAQHLEFDALRTALFLHDQCDFPIAFVGNHDVLKRTKTKSAAFDQIGDRLFYRVDIPGPSKEDIVAFGVAYNVESAPAYDLLVRFGLATSLRQVDALLRQAADFAGDTGRIGLTEIKDALVILKGSQTAKSFLSGGKD